MPKNLAIALVVCLAASAAFAQAPAKDAGQPSTEQLLKDFRADMQGAKADILAKNMSLSAEQAAKFWPLYDKYQKEQNVVIDEQLKTIQEYVSNYKTLTDAHALSLLNANLDRDEKTVSLRRKWLPEFQKVLGAKLAVRAMEIDRQLSLAGQFAIADRIPLAH